MQLALGPVDARILIVGDHLGADDTVRGLPWQGSAGAELRRELSEAGIDPNSCRFTNILNFRPPSGDLDGIFDFDKKVPLSTAVNQGISAFNLEVERCRPDLIIALGGLACYAACGDSAISTWRGSLLEYRTPSHSCKLIPTYHPSQIMRNWDWRAIALTDLRRAANEAKTRDFNWPRYNFHIRPGYESVMATLDQLDAMVAVQPTRLSVDIETRLGFTACIGIAWSRLDAVCIPLMCVENLQGYWDSEQELAITLRLRRLLTHENARVVGQNFIYDSQYFAKESGYVPRVTDDTMLMQHCLFPGMPKGLDFLASMYCDKYVYWKGEGKDWDPSVPEEQLWVYNCKDACYTYEIAEVLPPAIEQAGLSEQYAFQMQLWNSVLRMILRGVKIDLKYRQQLAGELLTEIQTRENLLQQLCGHPLNPRSPKQLQNFFYEDLRLPKQYSRKGKRNVTTDDEALEKLGTLEPLISPVTNRIREMRSLGVFLSTFVRAELDHDNRMRSNFNPGGTETFRFASSKNAFGGGTNLQNVPKGDEDQEHDANKLILPNIRKLFIPDQGFIIFDVDLAGADAQVVAWEADDDILKAIFRSGQKVHAVNCKDIFGGDAGPDGKREPYYTRAKMGCHLTNYGGKPRTLSVALGLTIHEAEKFQNRWFQIHPGIKEWHKRIESQLQTSRTVSNKFGYRRFYFDRIDGLLPQALAWIPQSTVACVTNRQLHAVETQLPEVQLLIQVHDSLVGQCPAWRWKYVKPRLRELLKVTIPYADPLVIGNGLKTSMVSWGHCEDEKWDA